MNEVDLVHFKQQKMQSNLEKRNMFKGATVLIKKELLTFFYDVVASLYDISPEMITFLQCSVFLLYSYIPFIFSWGVMQYLLLLLSILKKACLMNIIHSNDVVPALSLRSKNKLRGYAWLKGLKALLLVLNENHNSINVQFKRTTFDHNKSHLSWLNGDQVREKTTFAKYIFVLCMYWYEHVTSFFILFTNHMLL